MRLTFPPRSLIFHNLYLSFRGKHESLTRLALQILPHGLYTLNCRPCICISLAVLASLDEFVNPYTIFIHLRRLLAHVKHRVPVMLMTDSWRAI